MREKEIPCPSSCQFLVSHRSYQEKRTLEKRTSSPVPKGSHRDGSQGEEKTAWLAFRIEAAILDYARARSGFSDRDVVLALEHAKEKVEKGTRRLLLPGDSLRPGHEAGEYIYRVVESSHFPSSVLLTTEGGRYSDQEKIACLNRVVLSAKSVAGNEISERSYLRDLVERFTQVGSPATENKILTLP